MSQELSSSLQFKFAQFYTLVMKKMQNMKNLYILHSIIPKLEIQRSMWIEVELLDLTLIP